MCGETRVYGHNYYGPNSDSLVRHYLTTVIHPLAIRKGDPPQLRDILAVL